MTTELMFVADIGGTNARFSIAERVGGAFRLIETRRLQAAEYETVEDAARAYLSAADVKVNQACFAVAGPVTDGSVSFTNSDWGFSSPELKRVLELDHLEAVNDFYALAKGVDHLPQSAFTTVKEGVSDQNAPRLVIGPGTGFGQALIAPTPNGTNVISTEGGHVAFAPCTEEEDEIKRVLTQEFKRVTVELLLSGQGLVNLYRALSQIAGEAYSPIEAQEISQAAINHSDPIAVKTVDMFCTLLGRVAGDGVFGTGARGGVVLGGGILPKIQKFFLQSAFVDSFLDKGRMTSYIADVPIKMILTDDTALYGAAAVLRA